MRMKRTRCARVGIESRSQELPSSTSTEAGLVRGEWIKPGAVVLDAGYNPGNVGDVEFAAANERARLITPSLEELAP